MGLFHEVFSPEAGREELVPKMTVILQTARDIARGLDHIHKHNILHGDLTAGNILLTWSSPDDTSNQNFTAKVRHRTCWMDLGTVWSVAVPSLGMSSSLSQIGRGLGVFFLDPECKIANKGWGFPEKREERDQPKILFFEPSVRGQELGAQVPQRSKNVPVLGHRVSFPERWVS